MKIQHPLFWAILLFILGILWGHAFPCPFYFFALLLSLLGITFLTLTHRSPVLLTFVFWMLLGCCRASFAQENPNTDPPTFLTVLQQKAAQENQALVQRLKSSGLQGEEMQISTALLLGNKHQLQYVTKRKYAEVGASHLLALSGMHLGILYGILYLLFIRRIRYSQWRWFALPPILLCIWGYAFIAGLPISLCRAAIMFSILSILHLTEEDTLALQPLALSALLILFVHPDAIFDIGFQLSFAAVFFIVSLYTPLKIKLRIHNNLLCAFMLSVIAQLSTAPLCILYFHTLPLLSSLFSLILIPLTTIIIYAGLICIVFPASITIAALTFVVRLQNWLIDCFAGIPGCTIHNLYSSGWQVALIYILLLSAIFRLTYRDLSNWYQSDEKSVNI